MKGIKSIIRWLSDLKVAIFLLIIIAIASAIGTAIPQGDLPENYINNYELKPLIGLINGRLILFLQFDHIYSSYWFLTLLIWLGFALIVCSWRRQFPMLQAALRWVDYKSPRQIKKLILTKTIEIKNTSNAINKLTIHLENNGWKVNKKEGRIAARKGVIGRVGPPLVHLGLILLMIGSILGVLNGQKTESFLAPGRSITLLSPKGKSQLIINLKDFQIQRDSIGRPEQFRSKLEINENDQNIVRKEISVNHPLRFRGLTIYQADWSLAAITVQIGNSPKIQFPLKNLPELGDQIWGAVIPTSKDNTKPVLLTLSNEKGPIQVFNEKGSKITSIFPEGDAKEINGIDLKAINVSLNSGLLIKRDPGVPLVYLGFAVTLIGGILSILSTKQLWAIIENEKSLLHIGGLCNRDLSGFSEELPNLLNAALKNVNS
tara:strand:- start:36669 stop:37964 length:1296 start_codon:yes stop_codon:yes gene_type:complete